MVFTDILWLLVWGGMFTGIYNLHLAGGLSDPLALFSRPCGPSSLSLAAYLSLMWMLVKRPGFSFFRMPVAFLFGYFVGRASFLLFSCLRTG